MGIKRRTPTPEEIEAFGNAADEPTAEVQSREATAIPELIPDTARLPARSTATPRRVAPRGVPAVSQGWPEGVARSVTIRYPDPEIPKLLAQVAELADRSQHNVAVRALRRGLQDLLNETGGLTT